MGKSEMDLYKKYKPDKGYARIIEVGEMGITCLEFGLLNLDVGGSFFEDTADNEVILVVLGGRCELLVGHNGNKAHGLIGERANVFGGEAYRASIPYRTTYEILAHEEPVEVAVCKAPSFLETAAVILEPGDDFNRGEHALIVGETPIRSISGEAICFYRLTPTEEHASQRIYSEVDSFEQSVSLRHNNVLALPKGYHAELAEVEVRLYCLRISGS
jgi:5-deoxy-D-glucuronate isomerase